MALDLPVDGHLNIRVNRKRKREFIKACNEKGFHHSEVLRKFMDKCIDNPRNIQR